MSEHSNLHLTAEETALIERHLAFYQALDSGQRLPSTLAQQHFIAVCRCQAKATTPHEVTYTKYRLLRARNSQRTPDDQAGTSDGYGEGVPSPGWFTDEGWKRMRGQYLSNSD